MTNAQWVAVGVRIFCIWLAVYLIRQAPALWALNMREFSDSRAAAAVIIVTAVLVAVTIALWLFPLAVARRLLPKATLDAPAPLPLDQVQRVGFCLLGLWLLTETIPQMAYSAVIVYHSTRPNAAVELQPQNYAAMVRTVVEFALGLWLLFGARGLLGLIRWARTAGTGEPSNHGAESDAPQEALRAPHHGRQVP